MIFYDFIKFYNSLAIEKQRAINRINALKVRNVFFKKRGNKTYYFIKNSGKSPTKTTAISKKEYYLYSLENYHYRRAADELAEIDNLLKTQAKRAEGYLKKLEQYNRDLAKISKVQPLSKPSNYHSEHLIYETARGEKVRSKSEAIIADTLYKYGICYFYEPAFNGWSVLPDFYIRDNISGRSIIWEHFGMTDETDYEQKCFQKIVFYAKNGFILGDNLIITEERFDAVKAEETVKRFFTPQSLAA